MKIGILTFHCAHNYGAILQAYALQEVLTNRGHDVEFIDYQSPYLLRIYKWLTWKRFIHKDISISVREIGLLSKRKMRYDRFQRFIKDKLTLSKHSYNLQSYDVIIIGSDQVWNTTLTHGFDSMYWGAWNHQHTIVASYAASMEDKIVLEKKSKIAHFLKNFDYISVREKSIKEQLKQLTNKPIDVVVDPTLLLNREKWSDLGGKPIIEHDYILLYQVRNNNVALDIAHKIAAELKMKLVCLSARLDSCNDKVAISSGPMEFLSLFRHAKFVVCTSFHGTVFSIVYHVPFFSVILNDGKDARVINLLSQAGLSDRGISEYANHPLSPINWECVDECIEKLRRNSIDYLKQFC